MEKDSTVEKIPEKYLTMQPDELDVPGKTDETNESIRVAWENENIALMPGDSIVVKESTGTVNVSGEVYNPGLIEFKLGKSMRHYINAAGGITESGNNKSIMFPSREHYDRI